MPTPELEAMARAIYDATQAKWTGTPWEEADHTEHLRQARAALMAIREPSEGMWALAAKIVPAHELADGEDMIDAYQELIDHILGNPLRPESGEGE